MDRLPYVENMCFEGGGVRVLVYVGAIEELHQHTTLTHVRRFAGTSGGAGMAYLLALGMSPLKIRETITALDFAQFPDDSMLYLRDVLRLCREYGIYKGDAIREWLWWVARQQDSSLTQRFTFTDLHTHTGNDLHVVATNLSRKRVEVFSARTTPTAEVIPVVAASMSIPFLFVPFWYTGDVYVDGGVLMNYPVRVFDYPIFVPGYKRQETVPWSGSVTDMRVFNWRTLGFRVDDPQEIESQTLQTSHAVQRDHHTPRDHECDNAMQFVSALVGTMFDALNSMPMRSKDWDRTVVCNSLDYRTTQFDISAERRSHLMDQGRFGIVEYMTRARHFIDQCTALHQQQPQTK